MKWCNIEKKTRLQDWFVAPAPDVSVIDEAKIWAREHKSDGRFYNHYTNTRWWFEKEEDAIWFTLRFAG